LNFVDIVILLILAYSIIAGMYKGFVSSGLSLIGFIASWFGAYFSYPMLMNIALSNSTVMGFCSNLLEADSFFEGSDAIQLAESVANSDALTKVTEYISRKLPIIGTAFQNNVNSLTFSNKGIITLSGYLNETVWNAVFGVLAFIIMFAIIYFVVTMFINLINHIVSFPMLRKVDWLIGGLFGLLRGAVVALMVYFVADYVLTLFLAENSSVLIMLKDSTLLSFIRSITFLDVRGLLESVMGA